MARTRTRASGRADDHHLIDQGHRLPEVRDRPRFGHLMLTIPASAAPHRGTHRPPTADDVRDYEAEANASRCLTMPCDRPRLVPRGTRQPRHPCGSHHLACRSAGALAGGCLPDAARRCLLAHRKVMWCTEAAFTADRALSLLGSDRSLRCSGARDGSRGAAVRARTRLERPRALRSSR